MLAGPGPRHVGTLGTWKRGPVLSCRVLGLILTQTIIARHPRDERRLPWGRLLAEGRCLIVYYRVHLLLALASMLATSLEAGGLVALSLEKLFRETPHLRLSTGSGLAAAGLQHV